MVLAADAAPLPGGACRPAGCWRVVTARGAPPPRGAPGGLPALGAAAAGGRAGGGDVAVGRLRVGSGAAAAARSPPCRCPGLFDSRAASPHPIGLVGQHPARRRGDGSEFESIRPFHPGDRLRRVQWRVVLRTGSLHVTSTVAEEDAGVLLLVDSGVEVGVSGGVGGSASTLDVAVRAAGAVAEHYLIRGDRVGAAGPRARPAATPCTPPRVAGTCAGSWRRWPGSCPARATTSTPSGCGSRCPRARSCWSSRRCCPRPRWRRPACWPPAASTWWSWTACPRDVGPATVGRPAVALAWRMRLLERQGLLARVRGPGSRWSPGAGRARSTRCCAGWAPRRPHDGGRSVSRSGRGAVLDRLALSSRSSGLFRAVALAAPLVFLALVPARGRRVPPVVHRGRVLLAVLVALVPDSHAAARAGGLPRRPVAGRGPGLDLWTLAAAAPCSAPAPGVHPRVVRSARAGPRPRACCALGGRARRSAPRRSWSGWPRRALAFLDLPPSALARRGRRCWCCSAGGVGCRGRSAGRTTRAC